MTLTPKESVGVVLLATPLLVWPGVLWAIIIALAVSLFSLFILTQMVDFIDDTKPPRKTRR